MWKWRSPLECAAIILTSRATGKKVPAQYEAGCRSPYSAITIICLALRVDDKEQRQNTADSQGPGQTGDKPLSYQEQREALGKAVLENSK